ncbi:class E sortase [Phytoactinopolyspora halophila]|uniref:class E sortase n=1 Tax=Phytoactinopolyspora halophila TaxID=1981511 RepID=UPI001314E5AF|nr:class E sortase [Phytoactinopolyspora halophila]
MTPETTDVRRHAHRRRSPRRSPFAVFVGFIGELLLTAGVIVLLFVVYLLWGTGLQTASAQDDLREQLDFDQEQSDGDSSSSLQDLELGDAYGIIRIPRFGDDWEWVIVEGVEDDDLRNGPGHYPDSADPGELGNFGVAAHRAGHGEPFADFPELHVGDIVEVETAEGVFTYRLDDAPDGDSDGNKINISDTWVVDPVPGEPSSTEPDEARVTLTTCWPRLGSSHRMYATGTLIDVEER